MPDEPYVQADAYARIQHAVSHELLAAESLATAAPAVLRAIGGGLAMDAGAFWRLDAESGSLRCAGCWHSPALGGSVLDVVSRDAAFPSGVGLPGRVLQDGEPVWNSDILHDPNFPRREAAGAAGLRAAFAFPARGATGILGVFEFFQREMQSPDPALLHAVATLGNQVGQFLERERVQEDVRARAAHLRATLDTSLDAIISMDHNGLVTEWNRAATELFGYTRDEAMGRDMGVLIIPPPFREMHYAGLKRYLETGEPHIMNQRVELSGMRRDGSEFPVELTVTRIPLHGPPMFTGYIRDISDRKAAERERERLLAQERAARAEAERANRIKDEFLATLSHELRTPLNAILGWTHLLSAGPVPPDRLRHGVEVIERNSRIQARLIEDLLDMSRILSGKVRLEMQTVDLTTVVSAAVDSVMPTAEARSIQLDQNVAPHIPALRADPARLQQVIWNLLTNALKFTPKHGRVRISVAQEDSHVDVSVSDTGQGIAPDFLPYIFDRFRQEDASTTRMHGGLGIGLSIVKQIVEMHGGTVRADSPGEGQGTTVTIRLPVTPVQMSPPHPASPPGDRTEARPASHAPSLRGIRVLVVEDDADARDLIQAVLEAGAAEVSCTGTVADALNVLPAFQPHVILSDIGMPDEDGYALIRRVRALTPEQGGETPAAALTAFARAEDRHRALEAGFQEHLAKPVDPAELLSTVAALARGGAISESERKDR